MHRLAFVTLFASACLPGFSEFDDKELPEPPPPEPPAPVTEVSARVVDAGIGVSGVAVIFLGPDDQVVAERITDTTGTAKADLPDGGSVTVIRRAVVDNETRINAFTYAGVKPGDILDLANPRARGTAPRTVQLALPVPDLDEEFSLGAYLVITPCGSAAGIAPTIEITLDGCGTDTDFFVVDDTLGAFLARRPIAPTIDLSLETVRQDKETTLIAANTPDGVAVALEKRLMTDGFLLFTSNLIASSTTTTVPDIGAQPADQIVVAHVASPDAILTRTVSQREPYSMGTATVDLADMLLPTLSASVYDGTTVAWAQDEDGLPDLSVVTLTDGSITRTIAAPYTGASVRVPVLPPSAQLTVSLDATVSVAVAKATGGYDAVRSRILGRSLLEAAPMNGRIAISTDGTTASEAPVFP